jgi:uncharacterized protein with ParB-like and HNH nuclease domain
LSSIRKEQQDDLERKGEEMQPNYSSVGQVFSAQTRYSVPLFQRPYVWNKDEQWQPLWDDVRALADRVLNPPPHKPVAGHFLGTVVLEQIPTPAIDMPQRQVIDGQQRLTTLQLLLKAAEHALTITASKADPEAAHSIQLAAGQISQLSRNQFAHKPDDGYKVWPTNEDRAPFKAVMDCDVQKGVSGQSSRMAEAYNFFRGEILSWLGGGESGRRALAFVAALKDHLRLIVLDLDESDEPQAIFETLNAHGTPLLPADLMKNWLLWQAGKNGENANALYSSNWAHFDKDHEYWRKKIGAGHAARPRVDLFLQSWLTLATTQVVPVKHLYDRFLAHANQRGASSEDGLLQMSDLMEEIERYSRYYERIDNPRGKDGLDTLLVRLNRLDFVVFRPLLLALLGRESSSEQDRILATQAIESFLVRRMVCGMQTRGYGTLALDLLKVVSSVPPEGLAAPSIIGALGRQEGEWPDDEVFRHNWTTRPFYGWFRRDRVAMILQAIEERYQAQASKSEPVLHFDYSKLTIEHVMPQKWAANWPLPTGQDITRRETLIQNIGNLTLVSGKLNPSLSNAAWNAQGSNPGKRAGLQQHSDLKLNKRLLMDYQEWNETTIEHRAKTLFDDAKAIWPSAAALRNAVA